MATDNLLDEFPPVSTQSWEEAIARDLKGADYAKKLIWQTDEGLSVRPYYRAEALQGLSCLDTAPGEFPYLRGTRATGDWLIREEIDAVHPEEANRAACSAVVAGAEAISFRNVAIDNGSDLALLLANLQEIPVHFEDASEHLMRLLVARMIERKEAPLRSTGWNPLADLDFAEEVIPAAPDGLVPFTFHADEFEESGATAVEEVGFALAAGVDFLAAMQTRGIDIDRAAAAVSFSFAIGANYFFQIAKLRAFRLAWARVVESFGGSRQASKASIHARTSRWNETVYDPHVNILRGTTEAMSAILGGADSVTVAPFDECYKAPDEASRRLARNTQILLKQEALLSRVADPGAGSYCIEVITDFIARQGWKSMQQLEAYGGYGKALADGRIAQALKQSLAVREKAVASRRRVFTGTNQYGSLSEEALDRIDVQRISSTLRGTHAYEQIRLRTERHAAATGKIPRVVLAEIGDAKMRSARSNFATNFFACAGFGIVIQRFNNTDEIAACEADLIVLCSSDPEYLPLATALIAALKTQARATPVLVAGNPDSAAQLQAAGVADFIHVRSNPIELLTKWQQQLGIKE
jgi:methylmalonyl-CoA mutase